MKKLALALTLCSVAFPALAGDQFKMEPGYTDVPEVGELPILSDLIKESNVTLEEGIERLELRHLRTENDQVTAVQIDESTTEYTLPARVNLVYWKTNMTVPFSLLNKIRDWKIEDKKIKLGNGTIVYKGELTLKVRGGVTVGITFHDYETHGGSVASKLINGFEEKRMYSPLSSLLVRKLDTLPAVLNGLANDAQKKVNERGSSAPAPTPGRMDRMKKKLDDATKSLEETFKKAPINIVP